MSWAYWPRSRPPGPGRAPERPSWTKPSCPVRRLADAPRSSSSTGPGVVVGGLSAGPSRLLQQQGFPQVRRLSAVTLESRGNTMHLGTKSTGALASGSAAPATGALPSPAQIEAWVAELATGADRCASDAERIDTLRALEVLKNAAEGAQASVTVRFATSPAQGPAGRPGAAASTRPRDRSAGGAGPAPVTPPRQAPGGPGHGAAHRLLPHAGCLRAGKISEWRASLIVRETSCLSPWRPAGSQTPAWPEDTGSRLDRAGGATTSAGRRGAEARVPGSRRTQFLDRNAQAVQDRTGAQAATALDGMGYLTALLPVLQAVAVYAALRKHADSLSRPATRAGPATQIHGRPHCVEASPDRPGERGRGSHRVARS